jgi:hypothetical protein
VSRFRSSSCVAATSHTNFGIGGHLQRFGSSVAWFRSPHFGFAAPTMRTSEPPHWCADDPCKIVVAGALPAVSTISRSALVAQWTERRASTSGPCGFESCRGLHQRPRSSMDQSGGFRNLRLRVRIAPWTPQTPSPGCTGPAPSANTIKEKPGAMAGLIYRRDVRGRLAAEVAARIRPVAPARCRHDHDRRRHHNAVGPATA